jgi:hypothetical protein
VWGERIEDAVREVPEEEHVVRLHEGVLREEETIVGEGLDA